MDFPKISKESQIPVNKKNILNDYVLPKINNNFLFEKFKKNNISGWKNIEFLLNYERKSRFGEQKRTETNHN